MTNKKEQNDDGAELIHQTIPDGAETEPRPRHHEHCHFGRDAECDCVVAMSDGAGRDPGPWQLLSALAAIDSQKDVAEWYGISPQYLCDILKHRREISAHLAEKLGYRRTVEFHKIVSETALLVGERGKLMKKNDKAFTRLAPASANALRESDQRADQCAGSERG